MNMTETHQQTFFVLEIAPDIFLECYSQGCAYCGDKTIYRRMCDMFPNNERDKNDTTWMYHVKTFKGRRDVISYIRRNGTETDFFGWCKDLKKKFGGDGKPRIRKVIATLTAEIQEGEVLT